MSKSKIAVIGLGNSLRRDDGIGVIILESLFNHYQRPGVAYLDFGVASFDLIHRLQDYGKALLIDGISADLPAGALKIFSLEQAGFLIKGKALSSHEFNLKDIFKLTRDLGIMTEIYVAGIQVEDTGFGEFLSGPLKERLPEITGRIDSFLREKLI